MASGSCTRRYPDRDDVWRLRVYTSTGQRSETFHGTEKDARRRLERYRIEVEDTICQSGTVGELLEKWLRIKSHDLAAATYRSYEERVKNYLMPRFRNMPLSELRGRHLDDLYQDLLAGKGTASGGPLNPATIGQVHAVIRGACKQAVKWELIAANPALAASPPKLRKFELTPPTVEQIAAVLDVVAGDPYMLLFLRIAATTGARRGEVCALRWSDFDLEAAVVTIAHSVVNLPRHPLELKATKTGKAKRLALDARTVEMVEAQQAAQSAQAARNRVELVADPFLFPGAPDASQPWTPNTVTLRWRKVATKAGVTGVRLHDLRHALATRMLAAGDDIRTVAGRLGHADPSTTLRIYAHWVPEKDREAADRIGAEF